MSALVLLDTGYTKHGNWSLGQVCRHMSLTVDASIDGYPWWMSLAAPIRPLVRWLMLPKLLRGDSPAGLKTAPLFVPPGDISDADEVAVFAKSVKRLREHDGYLYPHPGFGKLAPDLLEQFHAAHAAHHLGFLTSSDSSSA